MPTFEYVHDGAEIYRRSFATIRAEADLARFPDDVATRARIRLVLGEELAAGAAATRAAG